MRTRLFSFFVLIAIILSGFQPAHAQDPQPPDDAAREEGLISSDDYPNNPGGDSVSSQAIGAESPGPDKFGYTSEEVLYSWIDASTGTSLGLTGYGGGKGTISLPFSFKFYEKTYTKLYITTYGYISFASSTWDDQQNLPVPSKPNDVIAPFWTPTYVDSNAWVKYKSFGTAPNRYFVVEWHNVQGGNSSNYTGSDDEYLFELILHENGDIVFQYNTMNVNSSFWCGVGGIEDSSGHDGLYYLPFCKMPPASSTAVRFYRPAASARALSFPDYQGVFTSPGVEKSFNIILRNTGEFGTDTFDLIKNSSWSLKLYNSNGSLLTDTDQDGKIDTGPIPQGGSLSILAKIKTPNGTIAGNYVDALIQARSSINSSKGDDIHLQLVIPAPFAQVYVDSQDGAMSLDLNLPEGQKHLQAGNGWGGYPSITASPVNGNFVYIWNAYRYLNGVSIRELIYAIYGPDGTLQRPAMNLTNHAGATSSMYDFEPSLVTTPNGRTGILWYQTVYDNSGNRNSNVFFAILDAAGNVAYGPENLTNNNSWGANNSVGVPFFYGLTISATTDNRFVFAWQRQQQESGGRVDDIYYGVRNSSGASVKSVTKLTNDTPGASAHQDPGMTSLNSKRVLLSWVSREDGNDDLYYSILDSNGDVYKSATNLSMDESAVDWTNGDTVQLSDGRIMVAWEAWGCFPGEWVPRIRYAILSSTYTRIGSPSCLENTLTKNNGVSGISVTADKNSRAIFTWTDVDGLDLYYALLGSNGTVISPPLLYRSTTASDNPYIEVSRNGFGNAPYTLYKALQPIILVHGYQGADGTNPDGFNCELTHVTDEDIKLWDKSDPAASIPTLGNDLPNWFVEKNYQVWIAHLKSSKNNGTPSLEFNAACLKNQINYVYSVNPQPIIIVAHSMGGLVTRAAVRKMEDPGQKIKSVFTLGSPHGGLPTSVTRVYGSLAKQTAVTEMTEAMMNGTDGFNGRTYNQKNVDYFFIGGDASPVLSLGPILYGWQGMHDGLVSINSALGWNRSKNFDPSQWPLASNPGQYVTHESHTADWGNSYYTAPSQTAYSYAFQCIIDLIDDSSLDNNQSACKTAADAGLSLSATSSGTPTEVESLDTAASSEYTEIKTGHLESGQSASTPIVIDTSSTALFYLTWEGEKPAFTLTRPDNQVIDPAYAASHPLEVRFTDFPGSAEIPPYQTYDFTATQPGAWLLNISASGAVDYQAFATLDSSRSLTVQTNADSYSIGNTATITATLTSNGIGLTGGVVTAKLRRADSVEDLLTLVEQGNGSYTANYTIPSAPGYLSIDVTASGSDNGTNYSRQANTLVSVKSNNLQMTGVYSDQLADVDADGMYDELQFSMGVNLTEAGPYSVVSELYAGTELISQSGDLFDLPAGPQTIQVSFDGTAIRTSGLSGPYIITHLYLTPAETGIPDQHLDNVWTTAAYAPTQFGSCNVLTLTHSGLGGDPIATPANSAGCPAGEYSEGELISLSATPDLGWTVSGWSGTSDNAAGSSNTVTMPSSAHIVGVTYSQLCFSLNASVSPTGSGVINAEPLPNCNGGTQYTYGTNVELTALANTGYQFDEWLGGASGSTNPVVVAMTEPKSVVADYLTIGLPRPPVLVSPASGAITVDYTPTLDWNETTPVPDHYHFQFASASSFGASSLLYDQDVTPTIFDIPADLPPGKTFYWRVKGINSFGSAGSWSAVRTIRTGWLPPTLVSPADGSHELTLRPYLDWSDVPGAAGYSIQFSKNSTFTQVVHTGSAIGSSYVPAVDLPKNMTIYWRVQTKGVNGPSAFTPYRTLTTPVLPPPAPVLTLPVNNALVTTYTPTFTWKQVVMPVGTTFQNYILQVDDSADFGSPVINKNDVNTNTFTPTDALLSNTKYYWRVRAVNNSGEMSNWSAAWYFRSAMLPPVLVSPADPFASKELRPLFDWDPPTGPGAITGYTIQIAKDTLFKVIVHTGNPVTSFYTPTVDLPKNTTLYWRVLTKGANGPSLYSGYRTLTTPVLPPPAPVLTLPATNALVTTYKPTFTWKQVVMPVGTIFQSYIVQVDDSADFSSPEINEINLVTPTFTPTDDLLSNTKYYWRVRAVNASGEMGNWSAVWTLRAAILPPGVVAPVDGATGLSKLPLLDWSDVSGNTGYVLQVYKKGATPVLVKSVTLAKDISQYQFLTNLLPNTEYYWKVQTKGTNGPSLWSENFDFTTGP